MCTLRTWITQVCRNVNVASARRDNRALDWINKTREFGMKVQNIAEVDNLVMLNKLQTSLFEILAADLLKQVNIKEQALSAKGDYIKGSHLLFVILQQFRTNAHLGVTYSIEDLFVASLLWGQ